MNEQDRFKEIVKVAADATTTIVGITKKLADYEIDEVYDAVMNDLAGLVYQLGYIKGLSYVPENPELIGDEK